jgi:hypothetical protein
MSRPAWDYQPNLLWVVDPNIKRMDPGLVDEQVVHVDLQPAAPAYVEPDADALHIALQATG